MSEISVNSILDASGGATTTINGFTPTVSNMAGRNRLINSDMRIDQRNAGASVTPTNAAYTLDRWRGLVGATSKFTLQQNQGSVTPPEGFTNYLGITSSSAYAVASSERFAIQQYIEGFNIADLGWGTASAKAVTLSLWVRSSLTGSFGGSLQNSDGTRGYPFEYTISSANTWEFKTITVIGDTSGTWLTTNGRGVLLNLAFGVGATYSGTAGAWAGANYSSATGATSVVGTSGATFYITGVQLETGSVATPFEHRMYGQELALCQRYYSTSFPVGTTPVQNSGIYTWKVSILSSGYGTFNQIQYPVSMRITGTTITGYNGGATNTLVRNIPAASDITNLYTYATSTGGFVMQCYGGGDTMGAPVGWNWSASAEL